jgi:putative transposase
VLKRSRHLAHVASFYDQPIVFITTSTARRRPMLASADVETILRDIWARSADRDGWWTGQYVLMPDHVHLFARPAIEARPLADWMQMWKSVSARKMANALQLEPPIWQEDYFDRYLRSSDNYSAKWQ